MYSYSGGSSGSVGSLIAGSSSSSSVHNHLNQHLTQHNGDGAFSDSGQGSEPDDGTIMCYQFKIPSHMTGGDICTLDPDCMVSVLSKGTSIYDVRTEGGLAQKKL